MFCRTILRQTRSRLPLTVPLFSTMTRTRSAKALLSHQERTATEPRHADLHAAVVSNVTSVNDQIKKFRFDIKDTAGFNFLAGQWLDVFVPNVEKAGGFTITSSPQNALPKTDPDHKPFFELAIQKSPKNPSAAWLWQPEQDVLGKEVNVRIGGSFVFPPPGVDMNRIKRVVFITGGVGINPIMSMLSYAHENYPNLEVRVLYSTKVPSRETDPTEVLFLPEMLELFRIPRSETTKDRLELFFTGTVDGSDMGTQNEAPIRPLMALTLPKIDSDTEVPVLAWTHRIDETALTSAVGNQTQARQSVFYVCGPPDMTDELVDYLKQQPIVVEKRILCEKWW